MSTVALPHRFVRRTSLNPDEYRTNFRQIDCDVIAALISDEASKVTPHMSKIYLALVTAPSEYWEREGVLRLAGREREGEWQTAWDQLVELLGVASATARKALAWMSQQGVIGYFAGRNGVGIRIFLNRAASSIAQKPHQGQKNLRLVRASPDARHASSDEVPFKESFAILENLDLGLDPDAPENGAPEITANRESSAPEIVSRRVPVPDAGMSTPGSNLEVTTPAISSAAIVEQIVREIAPQVRAATAREHERTREWFADYALPKAVRVAQRSAYDVLRAHGLITEPNSRDRRPNRADDRQVGKHPVAEVAARSLADEDIAELAESCVALLVTQGQQIDLTLSEMGVDAGGFLLPEDATRVRARAEVLISAGVAKP